MVKQNYEKAGLHKVSPYNFHNSKDIYPYTFLDQKKGALCGVPFRFLFRGSEVSPCDSRVGIESSDFLDISFTWKFK